MFAPRGLPIRWKPYTDKAVRSKNFLSDPFFLCGIFYYKGLVKFLTVHWTDLLWILGRLSLGVFAALTCTLECPPLWICAEQPSSPRDGLPPLAYRSPTVTRDTCVFLLLLLSSTHAGTDRLPNGYQKSTQTAFSRFTRSMRPFHLSFAGTVSKGQRIHRGILYLVILTIFSTSLSRFLCLLY